MPGTKGRSGRKQYAKKKNCLDADAAPGARRRSHPVLSRVSRAGGGPRRSRLPCGAATWQMDWPLPRPRRCPGSPT